MLVLTLLLLTFMGDALRDALDPRKADRMSEASGVTGGDAPHAHDPLLEVQGLRVAFGGKEVVHGIDFRDRARARSWRWSANRAPARPSRRWPAAAGAERRARRGSASLFGPQGTPDARDLLALSERELRGIRGKEIAMIFQEPMTALNPLYHAWATRSPRCCELHEGLTHARRVRGRGRSCWPTPASPSRSAAPAPFRTSSRAGSASAP